MSKSMLMITSVASMIQQFNMDNIATLQGLGYQVHVATNFEHGSTMSPEENQKLKLKLKQIGVYTHQVDFPRGIGTPRTLKIAMGQLIKITKENKFYFIHCQSPVGGVCGRIVGHKYHVKVIYTAHGFQFFHGSSKLSWLMIYPVEKFLSRYTDVLITVNQEDTKLAKEKFHAKSVRYVPGIGIDVEHIQSITVDRARKRRELGIPEDATVILSVGELNVNKNHSSVLKALSALNQSNIFYVICGIGEKKDELLKIAQSNGFAEHFKLLGYRTDVLEIMKTVDVFVFPSFREGLPVSLMEAMAAGLPIVASNIRGNVDLIENGLNGYLVDPKSVNELVEYIHHLTNDDKQLRSFILEGYKKVSSFSTTIVREYMQDIYSSF
ncbi:glycosyltransferase [Lapidilactobacillus concavus DSM 17758]|uniref:Glycosyltransferase n=1 Tax=Lapidilactobacillus concavus DSM 17758 TaxID=1423735 RepID=A0A0R1VQQ4_9LACO|nr:glycosyltransferase family 4 protein [Lapidilactobacillus concavus]KRM07773.1 glycosyltransferase [Lapidilactobacillus concavus DSM 17758]GEL13706.1 glycosyl transferase family 1 [Lapidilactobacillus concavus]